MAEEQANQAQKPVSGTGLERNPDRTSSYPFFAPIGSLQVPFEAYT
jgi:hypothetical protein